MQKIAIRKYKMRDNDIASLSTQAAKKVMHINVGKASNAII